MKTKARNTFGLAALLAIAGMTAPAFAAEETVQSIVKCNSPSGEIKIGGLYELSGPISSYGINRSLGAQVAQNFLNSDGGIKVGADCLSVRVLIEDDRSDKAATVALTTKYVQDENVRFLLGPSTTGLAAGLNSISQAGTPAAIHMSNNLGWDITGLTGSKENPGLFRNAPMETYAQSSYAQLIIEKFKPKTVAFLWGDDDTARTAVPNLERIFAAAGVKTHTELVPTNSTDYSAALNRIKASNPDVLYVGWVPSPMIAMIRQAVELQAAPAVFAHAGTPSFALKDAVGGPLPIPFMTVSNNIDAVYTTNPAAKGIFAQAEKIKGSPLDTNAGAMAYDYDFVLMLAKAIQNVGNAEDTAKIADELSAMRFSGGLLPSVCFSKSRAAIFPLDVTYVENGKVDVSLYKPDAGLCAGS